MHKWIKHVLGVFNISMDISIIKLSISLSSLYLRLLRIDLLPALFSLILNSLKLSIRIG